MAEEIKVLSPRDQDPGQKAIVEETYYQWKEHPVVKNWHGYWQEWLAWFWGDQYTFYNEVTCELEDLTPLIEREVKNVYNRILPMIRQQWGELRYPHKFYVEPNTQEPEDIKASKIGSGAIEYTNLLRRFGSKASLAKLWGLITGNIFWKEWWNKTLFGYIEGSKQKITKEPGDVDFNFVNPFNVRPDPLAKTREGWRWFIEAKEVPKSALEDEFGLERGSLPSDSTTRTETDLFKSRSFAKPKEETVLRFERWERPSKKYSDGRFLVMGSGYLFYDGENDAPENQIPYFQIPGVLPILDEQWYDSPVRLAQNAQRQLNRNRSIIDEYIENFKPKAMIPRGSLIGEELKAYTRLGVDYVIYNPVGAGTPFWQNPPPLPETIAASIAFNEREIESATSMREVSFARLPKYSTRASGVLFRGLREQDEKVLLPVVEEQDLAWAEAMKFRLQLIQKHYSQPRLVKILGKNKATEVVFLKSADLRDNTDVRIESGLNLFTTREAKKEVVMAFVEKGMIKEPREALELLDMKGIEEYMEEQFVDERQAYREIEIIKAGKTYPVVNPDDNHDVHFRIQNNQRKTEDFQTWPKKSQDWLVKHITEHKEFMGTAEKTKAPPRPEAPAMAPELMPAPAIPGGIPPGIPTPGPGGGAMSPEEVLLELVRQTQGGP